MAIDLVAQRLQIGDVVLLDRLEAKVVRAPLRTDTVVRTTLRAEGRADFVKEWSLDELVTVVRGP